MLHHTNRGVDADLPAECRPVAKHGHPGWDRLDPGCSLIPHAGGGLISQQRQAAGQHVFTTSANPANPAGEAAAGVHHRPAAPVRQQSPTSEDDCFRHSWHREVLPHQLPPTSPAAPAAGCSSNWCGRLQHRWPDPPFPPQPAHQSRVQGASRPSQRSSISSLTRCQWWGGRSSARLTDVSARPSLTTPRRCLEDAPAFSSEISARLLLSWTCPSTPPTLALSSLTRGEQPTRPSSRQWCWTRSCGRLARTLSR